MLSTMTSPSDSFFTADAFYCEDEHVSLVIEKYVQGTIVGLDVGVAAQVRFSDGVVIGG